MYLFDTFTNFLSGMGMPGRDKMTGVRHVTTVWTRDQLEASYRSGLDRTQGHCDSSA